MTYSLKYGEVLPSEICDRTIYLSKDNDKISYKFLSPQKSHMTGELDISIENEDELDCFIYEHKNEILELLSQQGHRPEPVEGLSKQEWINETHKRLTQYSHLDSEDPSSIRKIKNYAHHYGCLVYLLKMLNLDIGITKEMLDI